MVFGWFTQKDVLAACDVGFLTVTFGRPSLDDSDPPLVEVVSEEMLNQRKSLDNFQQILTEISSAPSVIDESSPKRWPSPSSRTPRSTTWPWRLSGHHFTA